MKTHPTWTDANRRYLLARVRAVAARIETGCAPSPAGGAVAELSEAAAAEIAVARAALAGPSALDLIAQQFGLSEFELNVLVLCAGRHVEPGFGTICARAQPHLLHGEPTFGLALRVLPEADWAALAPVAPLRFWRLLEAVGDLTTGPLRIAERLLHFLLGLDHLDERLLNRFRPVTEAKTSSSSHEALAEQLASAEQILVVQLLTRDSSAARNLATRVAAGFRRQLFRCRVGDLAAAGAEQELLRIWDRDARLCDAVLLIECDDTESPENLSTLRSWLEHTRTPTLVQRREALVLDRDIKVLELPMQSQQERAQAWRTALGSAAAELNGEIDRLAAHFEFGPDELRLVAAAAADDPESARGENPELLVDALWRRSRETARQPLDQFAQRIEPVATWADLVVPPQVEQVLRDIAAHVRNRHIVYDQWQFALKSARGLGISALFSGPSGTGKTMAAEVLARELRLDLYRVDLAGVVSKYIGETEKNLRRVFDAAERSGAILLFDEADALFGKRSEVQDSHDRYANLEVSYLLQRMEAYRGLAILTTNLKDSLDPAFLRRLRFIVGFPFPDHAQRAEIWKRVFPAAVPAAQIDVNKLARLNVAGGSIRNIALGAAFLAADERAPVRMAHLLRSAKSEYAKLEKPLNESETKDWQ